jgi:uncharacterized membrane protein
MSKIPSEIQKNLILYYFIMFDFTLLLSAIVFVTLDYFYLNSIKGYFGKQVQSVQGSPLKMNFLGAIICYIFLIFGINYFIIKPKRSIQDAFLLGLVIYGVFETTNITLFTNWSWITVIIDTLWGGTLFALTAYIIRFFRQ